MPRAAAVIDDASRDLKRLPTYSKERGDIVSTADKEAEQAIVATIAAAFPDHAIAGEYAGMIRAGSDGVCRLELARAAGSSASGGAKLVVAAVIEGNVANALIKIVPWDR